MANRNCYGTLETSSLEDGEDLNKEEGGGVRTSSDTMRSQGRSADGRRKEDVEMHPFGERAPEDDDSDSDESAQAGVKRAEAISSTWTTTGLYAAYLGMSLMATATSLEQQTTGQLTIFATSAFSAHALVSTVLVIQAVVLSVAKPPMSKFADVFGRFEAFTAAVLIYCVGYVMQATSSSLATYTTAQVFYATGQTGLQVLIQVFIADTSTLVNRALISTISDIPFLFTFWAGPPIAQDALPNWRLGYWVWAIVLPVTFLPLAITLAINQRKAAKQGLLPPSPFKGRSGKAMLTNLWYELDALGLLLISGSVALILIPLTLAKTSTWKDPKIIVMLAVGVACLITVPFVERSKRLAPRPFFPRGLFRNRTIIAGLAIPFFYFMAFYLSVYPYFQSYLLVVMDLSVTTAGYIVQVFTFAATITTIVVGFLIKQSRHYKRFVVIGAAIYVLGLAAMILFRTEDASIFTLVAAQMLIGIGGGMLHQPAQTGVQASVSHQEVAAVTAIFLTLLELGGAIGNAISGAIWSNNIPVKLREYLPPETQHQADDIFSDVDLAANGWAMGNPTRAAINRAYQETMTKLLIVALIISVPVLVLSFFMEDYDLSQMDQKVVGTVIGAHSEAGERRDSLGVGSSRARRESGSNEATGLLREADRLHGDDESDSDAGAGAEDVRPGSRGEAERQTAWGRKFRRRT